MRYSLGAFLLGVTVVCLSLGAGLRIGFWQGYDRGFRDGFDNAPLFDATHPKIGAWLEARPRNERD
jgi:hypothetical protein